MIQAISGRQFPAQVIPLIESSQKSLDIVVFDWRWYPQDPGAVCQLFNQTIIRAVRRGVKIRAIVNSADIAKILIAEHCQVKRPMTSKLLHCKLMIIDSAIVVVGSHNYTQKAFQMNLEFSVIIRDDPVIADVENFFNNLITL